MTDENNKEVGREGQSSAPSDDGRTVILQQTQGNGADGTAVSPTAPEEGCTVALPNGQNHQMDDIQKILKASQDSGKDTGSKKTPKKSRKPILIGGTVLIVVVAVGLIIFGKPGKQPVSQRGEDSVTLINGKEFCTMKNDESIEPQWPESTLDPKEIYKKIQYNTHMFYGEYSLVPDPNNDDEIEKWYADMNFDMHQTSEGRYLTDLPWSIQAGPNTMYSELHHNMDHDWMKLEYYTEDNDRYSMSAAYEVEGNVLRFTEVFWEYDRERETLTYELGNTYEYLFSFNGVQLTLSYGDKSVVLQASGFAKEDVRRQSDDYSIHVNHTTYPDADKIDGINCLSFDYTSKSNSIHFIDSSDKSIGDEIAQISKDGRIRFAFSDGHKVNTKYFYHEYVFFYCGSDGLILTDGDRYYYYQQNYYGNSKPYYPIP